MVDVVLYVEQSNAKWAHYRKQMPHPPSPGMLLDFPNGTRWEVRPDKKVLYDFNTNAYLAAIRYVGPTHGAQAHASPASDAQPIAAPTWW